jgi:hypothetical protein
MRDPAPADSSPPPADLANHGATQSNLAITHPPAPGDPVVGNTQPPAPGNPVIGNTQPPAPIKPSGSNQLSVLASPVAGATQPANGPASSQGSANDAVQVKQTASSTVGGPVDQRGEKSPVTPKLDGAAPSRIPAGNKAAAKRDQHGPDTPCDPSGDAFGSAHALPPCPK